MSIEFLHKNFGALCAEKLAFEWAQLPPKGGGVGRGNVCSSPGQALGLVVRLEAQGLVDLLLRPDMVLGQGAMPAWGTGGGAILAVCRGAGNFSAGGHGHTSL